MFLSADTIKLLRIPFSLFLMPIFLLALSQVTSLNYTGVLVSFIIFHLFVYPASNGYNSYVDKDTGSIGGLEKPPLPTRQLYYVSLVLDSLALIFAASFVNGLFALCLFVYMCASRAYSSRQIRLKRYPVLGFLTVVFFQGAFTYYTVILGIGSDGFRQDISSLFILLACSFQIAGAYPLTQIYQHKEDIDDGVITLSYTFGYKGTFLFTAIMFFLCNVFYFFYFKSVDRISNFYTLQLFFMPIVIYFGWWFYKVNQSEKNANYKNTMRMNWIASACMNTCFIVLYFINHQI